MGGGFPYKNRLQKRGYPSSNLSTGGPRLAIGFIWQLCPAPRFSTPLAWHFSFLRALQPEKGFLETTVLRRPPMAKAHVHTSWNSGRVGTGERNNYTAFIYCWNCCVLKSFIFPLKEQVLVGSLGIGLAKERGQFDVAKFFWSVVASSMFAENGWIISQPQWSAQPWDGCERPSQYRFAHRQKCRVGDWQKRAHA